MTQRRTWKDEYKPKFCPRCQKMLLRQDFGKSEVTEDRKQPLCRNCTEAELRSKKGQRYRSTAEGRITTIWGGLAYRTRQAKRQMTITREELGKLLRARKCSYCGHKLIKGHPDFRIAIDHVIPLAQGGDTSLDNLVPACHKCNHDKHDRSPSEWTARWYEIERS